MEEKEVLDLVEEAVEDQEVNPENEVQREEPVETLPIETPEIVEGVPVPDFDLKEEWAEDVQEVKENQAADAPSQKGSGAFSNARNSWANGWGVM